LRQRIDEQFAAWQSRHLQDPRKSLKSELIFVVIERRLGFELAVNFEDQRMAMFKEYRVFQNLKMSIQFHLKYIVEEMESLYPVVMSLRESLLTYQQLNLKVDKNLAPLAFRQKAQVQELLDQGAWKTWNLVEPKNALRSYSRQLADQVAAFEEVINTLLSSSEQIQATLTYLAGSPFEPEAFRAKFTTI